MVSPVTLIPLESRTLHSNQFVIGVKLINEQEALLNESRHSAQINFSMEKSRKVFQ
jgi:hypothetical protein